MLIVIRDQKSLINSPCTKLKKCVYCPFYIMSILSHSLKHERTCNLNRVGRHGKGHVNLSMKMTFAWKSLEASTSLRSIFFLNKSLVLLYVLMISSQVQGPVRRTYSVVKVLNRCKSCLRQEIGEETYYFTNEKWRGCLFDG